MCVWIEEKEELKSKVRTFFPIKKKHIHSDPLVLSYLGFNSRETLKKPCYGGKKLVE